MLENEVKLSKLLSKVLRHDPGSVGLSVDKNGWAVVSEVLDKCGMSIGILDRIVKLDNKNRFEYTSDKIKIRARQGHSIKVDLELIALCPPEMLYHGTVEKKSM